MLGFDARTCYTGRSPLEALSIGIDLKADDLAMRANLVTLSDNEPFEDKIMLDYSSGEIDADEARELMDCVKDNFNCDNSVSTRARVIATALWCPAQSPKRT